MSKKKVLFILSAYEIGGAEEYVHLLIKGLMHEYNITVLLPLSRKLDDFSKRFEAINVHVHRLIINDRRTYKIPSILPTFDIKQIFRIYNVIKKIGPDIIHINQSDTESGFSSIIAASMMRDVKVVSKLHITNSFKFMNVPFGFIRDKWVSFFLNLFSFTFITGSYDSKRLLCKNYAINENRVIVIHYGIDVEQFNKSKINDELESVKKKLGVCKGCSVIGFIGRLTTQKCPLDFLKIALRVIQKTNNVCFVVIGKGELENDMKRYIVRNNLNDKVKLLGFTDNIPQFISIMDILILPSLYESFGLVLAEAGAMNKPVIASKIGATEEVVEDGVTGFLVNHNDIEGFSKKISHLLEYPVVAKQMGAAARKRILERFTVEQMVKKTVAVYEEPEPA